MAFILDTICRKKIKDGTYVINLDEYSDVGRHYIAFFVTEEQKFKFIGNKNMIANIFRVQANN